MTDLEKTRSLFRDLGIPIYEERIRGKETDYGRQTVRVCIGDDGYDGRWEQGPYDGYNGFYADFWFDASTGKFLKYGCWE